MESFQIITQMINKAKNDFRETGVGALMWGSIVTFCSLISFGNYWWHTEALNYIWFLTFIAIIPQIIISINERKKKKYKGYNDDAMGGIWISFGITIFLLSFYNNLYRAEHSETLYLIIYGVPTFATGFSRRFMPMIIGGIACWVIAITSMYTTFPYTMLLTAAAAQLAWFIPGLILRRRYMKAKDRHV